ncbi:MAG: Gfo/Idh/MocA family protein, partial [Gemmatimonadales bacterium]
VRVTAVSSGRMETATDAARECGARAFGSGEEVAQSPEVDVVLVSSPPDTHRRYALAALAAGKHVVCEKPMALSVGQAEEMVRAAAAHPDRLALVDHELRYEPNRRRVRELIRAGAIGDVRHIELQLKPYLRGDGRPQAFTAPWSWWSERSRFGGLWGAVGSHLVDLCRYWLGEEPSRVAGTVQTFIKQRPDPSGAGMKPVTSDDYVHAVLEFPGGTRATLSLSAVAHHGRGHRGEITGSDGTLVVEGEHQLFHGKPGGELEEITVPDPHWGKTTPNSMWARSFLKLMEDLVGRITGRGKGDEVIAATFADGLAVQRVLDAVGGPRD